MYCLFTEVSIQYSFTWYRFFPCFGFCLVRQPPDEFYKKAVLKTFAIFTGKRLRWSLFLTKLVAVRAAISLERDSNTVAFLRILRMRKAGTEMLEMLTNIQNNRMR